MIRGFGSRVALGLAIGAVVAATASCSASPETPDAQANGQGSVLVDSGADGTTAGLCGPDAAASVTIPVDAAKCGYGRLVAAVPTTITAPDPDPNNLALAASSSGDRFLAIWTDGGFTINTTTVPETVWSALVQPTGSGVVVSTPVQLAANGACPVAAWTGNGFVVVWGDDSGLRMQTLDAAGALSGKASDVLLRPNGQECPMSLVALDRGLALAWTEGQSVLKENVGVIGSGGALGNPVLLDTVGPGVSAQVTLAQFQGATYAAFVEWPNNQAETAVSQINWDQGMATPVGSGPGFLGSFIATDGALWFDTTGGNGWALYAGTGAAFHATAQTCSPNTSLDLVADGCGRFVGFGNEGYTPAGVAEGFFAQSLGDAPSQRQVLGGVSGSAYAGAQSTFGVLWYARIGPGFPEGDAQQTGTLSFTTLSWQ